MEIIITLDVHLVYVWSLLNNLISNPEDSRSISNLKAILNKNSLSDTRCFEFARSIWLKNHTEDTIAGILPSLELENRVNNELILLFTELNSSLDSYFSLQLKEIDPLNDINNWLDYAIELLNSINKDNINNRTDYVIKNLSNISTKLKEENLKDIDDDNISWNKYLIYLYLKGYIQFFENTKITDNNFNDLELFYGFYSKLAKKPIQPVFVLSNDDNMVIEPTMFPDKMYQKLFQTIDIEIEENDNYYILNSIDKNVIDNPLLLALFAHEIGHLFDINFMALSNAVINKFIYQYPDYFMTLNKQCLQWIRELIADAFAISLLGPAYMFALIIYITNEEMMVPAISHPGMSFRLRALYTYLYQNEFINLLSPQSFEILQNKLQNIQQKFSTQAGDLLQYEKIMEQYISMIYHTTIEFLLNTCVYSSYDKISALICMNNGNLEEAKDSISKNNKSLNDLIVYYNLLWLIELKNNKKALEPVQI